VELHRYARSLQKAAKALVEKLELDQSARTDWDVGPIILLYRTAVELQLKAVVGEGSRFLRTETDHVTLYKTHSLRWLAQVVSQIIKKVGWESEFKCEGVVSLADFSALVNELEAVEPVACAVHADKLGLPAIIPAQLQKSKAIELFPRLDGLVDLLAATADGLAAECDPQADAAGEETFDAGDDFKPTIQ
jgi:hypothetical protein